MLVGSLAIPIIVIYAVVVVVFLDLLLWEVALIVRAQWDGTPLGDSALTKELGLLFVALIGAPFVAVRTWSAWKQASTAEQRHRTEWLAHATAQISLTTRRPSVKKYAGNYLVVEDQSPDVEARMVGLRELARISERSRADHLVAIANVCSYVRLNAPRASSHLQPVTVRSPSNPLPAFQPRPDIVEAMRVLRSRSRERRHYEKSKRFWIDLSHTPLRQLDLKEAEFAYASLSTVDFTQSDLTGADFKMAWMHYSLFDGADMESCKLGGARILGCKMKNALKLDREEVSKAYGVRNGDLKTELPDHFGDPPKDWNWFDPELEFSSDEKPTSHTTFFGRYQTRYEEFCELRGLPFIPSR